MKNTKIIFWSATLLIFLFQGVMPALTGHTELAKEGIRHLGYPEYFGTALAICKVLGALALMVTIVPAGWKEWAYAGFTFDLIFACISNVAIDGLSGLAFFPLIVLAVLMVSYISYHKLNQTNEKFNIFQHRPVHI